MCVLVCYVCPGLLYVSWFIMRVMVYYVIVAFLGHIPILHSKKQHG